MQHGEELKQTKIGLRSDYAVGSSSTMHGANIDGMAFNTKFISQRDPMLLIEILRLFDRARELKVDSPTAPDSEFLKAHKELLKLNLPPNTREYLEMIGDE